jgi:phage major head subunit gpT-like protein
MAVNRANFAALMEPGLREIYYEAYEARPSCMEQVFTVTGSKKQTETDQRIAGLGAWNKKVEGADVTYEDITLADSVTYTHDTWEKAIQVTEEMIEDELYGELKKMTKELGRTGKIEVEDQSSDLFNNGFATVTGYDGKVLFASDHPDRGGAGGTQSNVASASALSDATLKTGLIAVRKQKNEAGQLINAQADQLIVPDDLEFTAMEITMSALKSGVTDNDVNTIKGRVTVKVWGYLSSATAWFLRDSGLAQNIFMWRVKPQFNSEVDFDSGNVKFKGRMRFSYGWSDWRGLYGNAGA